MKRNRLIQTLISKYSEKLAGMKLSWSQCWDFVYSDWTGRLSMVEIDAIVDDLASRGVCFPGRLI